MVFTAASRERAFEAEPRWPFKLVIRLLAIVAAIVCIALTASTFEQSFGLIVIAGPIACSLVWNFIVVIVRMCRAKPVHPGAAVGCDLIIWLFFCVGLFFNFAAIVIWENISVLKTVDPDTYAALCDDESESQCQTTFSQLAGIGNAASTAAIVCLILHFVLFVWACVDTHSYRKAKRQGTLYQPRAKVENQYS